MEFATICFYTKTSQFEVAVSFLVEFFCQTNIVENIAANFAGCKKHRFCFFQFRSLSEARILGPTFDFTWTKFYCMLSKTIVSFKIFPGVIR